MTAHQAIKELKQVRQYCTASAIPAIDYAIQVLQGLAEREKKLEEEKKHQPCGPDRRENPRLTNKRPHPFGRGLSLFYGIFLSPPHRRRGYA